MAERKKQKIYRADYTPPPFFVDSIELRLELDPVATRVSSRLRCRANPQARDTSTLVLNGERLELAGVRLQGVALDSSRYHHDGSLLTIRDVPDAFTVEVDTVINPRDNTALEGLYLSSGNYCTQCEAEGFRRITCFPDRPDVMSVYT
ncbi:MAG TPA: aminopeptidase N, partial [Desulfobulbus sp.]|nr:aminopeptidase N [Desulfobulbus sp.]